MFLVKTPVISENRVVLARLALRAAIDLRRRAGVPRRAPLCVFDLCEKMGIEVRFSEGSSFEGIFSKTTNTIVVPSERPPGRQAFSCAHELGHWYFEHGSTIDELDKPENFESSSPQEVLASLFAGYLLMPPWTVKNLFDVRGWDPQYPASSQIFQIAGQLGVGYSTLTMHMRKSIDLINDNIARRLLAKSPKSIRKRILPSVRCEHLVVVDAHWDTLMPIDLRVGDYILIPESNSVVGNSLSKQYSENGRQICIARAPGIARVTGPGFACFARIRREGFTGRSIYRHLEDPDVNGSA